MRQQAGAIFLGLLGTFLAPTALQAQEDATAGAVLNVAGFYLGMERSEVGLLYEKLKSDGVAEFVAIESSEFRDLITVDQEFGSMGNKIELQYAESGEVTYIKFQYKTVAILLDHGGLEPSEFVQAFCEDHGIPAMDYQDMGFVKTWSYENADSGYKVSIDDSKNITLQRL